MPPDVWFQHIQFNVELHGFTRSGTQPFDVQAQFTWTFDELKYSLALNMIHEGRPSKFESIYNENIPRDDLDKAMDTYCSYFVNEVRKRANGKSQQ